MRNRTSGTRAVPAGSPWAGRRLLRGSALALALILPLPLLAAPAGDGDAPEAPEATGAAPVFIRAARVIQRPGQVLEDAQVLIEEGLVVAVGRDLEPPEGALVLEGQVVCAGFLDPWSALGLASDSLDETSTSASTRTADALIPLDLSLYHQRLEALRAGITAVRVQCGKHAPVAGLGAIVGLDPTLELWEAVLLEDADLAMSVGLSDGRGPQRTVRRMPDGTMAVETSGPPAVDVFERIDHVDRVISNIASGKKYRDDLREYRAKLAEWEKAIAEKEAELEKDFRKAKRDREKELAEAKEKGREPKEKRYREDRKPRKPRYDEDKEVLGRIADGELPLVVEVHRSAEIRALLEGTEDFGRLRLILAGATEALAHADELARRGVAVLVWPALRGTGGLDEHEAHDLSLAGELAARGVTVLLGSGGREAAATRDLPLLAALAVAHGLPEDKALEALTIGAARAFDLADELGSVEFGKRADLLILDGDPLDAATRVRYVLTAGHLAVTPEES